MQDGANKPLSHEAHLLEMLFREQIENGAVQVKHFNESVEKYATHKSRRSLCHCLAVSTGGVELAAEDAALTQFQVDGPRPHVVLDHAALNMEELEDPFDAWTQTLERLLEMWV